LKTVFKKLHASAKALPKSADTTIGRKNELTVPAKASIALTLSNLIGRGAAVLFTPFFTRLLSPEEYGGYALFNSYLSIIALIGTLELGGGVIFRIFQKNYGKENRVIRSAILLITCTISITYLAFLAANLTRGGGEAIPYAHILLPLTAIFSSIISIFSAYCKFKYKYKPYLVISLLTGVISPLIAILILRFAEIPEGVGATVRVASLTAVYVICAVVVITKVFANARREHTPDYAPEKSCLIRQLLTAALPLLPYYISVMLISQLDKIMIDGFLGGSELGKYSVAYSCGIALSSVTSGVSQTFSAWTMRKIRQGNYKKIRSLTHSAEIILSLVILIFLCFIPEVFSLLAPSEYMSSMSAVYPIALCVLPIFLSGITTSASLYFEKRIGISLTGICAGGICAAINLFLIPRIGVVGASISAFISYLTLFLLSSINFKRLSKSSIINVNKSAQNLLFCGFFAAVLFTLKDYFIIRVSIAFILICCLAAAAIRSKNLITEKT